MAESRLAKVLLFISAIYVISQVVLLLTLGANLLWIMLSLGLFLASLVISTMAIV
ncbi:MAG: hypothetical protein SFU91_07920 [Chloroherpetonaceae bacterium]|nr:hypothetical protein [Chloroherpetonaceae bacterium]